MPSFCLVSGMGNICGFGFQPRDRIRFFLLRPPVSPNDFPPVNPYFFRRKSARGQVLSSDIATTTTTCRDGRGARNSVGPLGGATGVDADRRLETLPPLGGFVVARRVVPLSGGKAGARRPIATFGGWPETCDALYHFCVFSRQPRRADTVRMDYPFKKTAPAPKLDPATVRPLSTHLSAAEAASLTAVEPVAVVGSPSPVPATSDDDRDAQLDQHRRAVLRIKRNAAKQVIELGKHLEAAQKLHGDGRGQFHLWLAKQCGLTRRTAYNAMAVWREFSDCATVAQYDIGALYALAAESCPPAAITAAAALADNREKISQRKAKAIIKQHTIAEVKPPKAKPRTWTIGTSIGQVTIQADDQNATPAEVLAALVAKLQSMRKAA